ncbi:MAG: hypothetical protein NDJ24_03005 [Alphaproteobacteria bacterium]|nr:hypothetical protein [Alphaproteobacteria bacterium]
MEITLSSKLLLIASCLLLVACAGETRAQVEERDKNLLPVSDSDLLSHKCEELKVREGKNYRVISGKVVRAGMVPLPAFDCFGNSNCQMPYETSFSAILDVSDDSKKSNEIVVYTMQETVENLQKKEPYLKTDKNYSFCGELILEASQFNRGKEVYSVVDLTLILER